MIKTLMKILFTIVCLLLYIIFVTIELFWKMEFKNLTSFFISGFMKFWDIKIDDL